MTTYCSPLLLSLVLLGACDPPSTNVGEVPTTTEASTEGETDAAPDTGSSTGTEGTGTETSLGAEETSADESTGITSATGDMEGGCLDSNFDCFEGFPTPLDCGGGPTCDVLQVNDPSLNEFDEEPFGFVNPDAATCILEGLAAGTVGSYRIDVEPGQQFSISYRLEVLTDGTVIIRSESQEDKTCFGHENRFERQPASYFEACEVETDEAAILACVLEAGDPAACVDQGHECPA